MSNTTAEPPARIAGQPVSLADAVARAATILGASRSAVVAGLATDVAGIEAAVALARRIGASLDHRDADTALRDMAVMRRDGWIVTTPLQARARADLLVFVGTGIANAWPRFSERLALTIPPVLVPDAMWKTVLIGADAATARQVQADAIVDMPQTDFSEALGFLRAVAAGRPVRPGYRHEAALRNLLPLLAAARYGVVLWAAGIPTLAVEMLVGLIDDLNRATRFAGLPLGTGAGNAEGAVQATAWRTGFPPRTGFGRGFAEHDPWRFDATRLVESGEADAALWIAPAAPGWTRTVPTVALAPAGTGHATPPEVAITVGEPGVDHDSVLHDPDLGTLAARRASRPGAAPAVAAVLESIAAALPC